MTYLFAPGCALLLYKPELARETHSVLQAQLGSMELLMTCCRHLPPIPENACVINICPGCDRRYREEYETPRTISLWELLADITSYSVPSFAGQQMTLLDACPTRNQDQVHEAMRHLASRMDIEIVEPAHTKRNQTCCGDILYGQVPTDQVVEEMKRKANEMPLDDIIVYCVSCVKAMFVGGRKPRYMLDLLFNEETLPAIYAPDAWHAQLDDFIREHASYQATSGLVTPSAVE